MTTDPYRSSAIKEICMECSELAAGACECCGHPLCTEHLDSEAGWCGQCERKYEKLVLRHEKRGEMLDDRLMEAEAKIVPFVLGGLAATMGAGFGIGSLLGLTELMSFLVGLVAMPVGTIGGVAAYRRVAHHKVKRRKFLKRLAGASRKGATRRKQLP